MTVEEDTCLSGLNWSEFKVNFHLLPYLIFFYYYFMQVLSACHIYFNYVMIIKKLVAELCGG